MIQAQARESPVTFEFRQSLPRLLIMTAEDATGVPAVPRGCAGQSRIGLYSGAADWYVWPRIADPLIDHSGGLPTRSGP